MTQVLFLRLAACVGRRQSQQPWGDGPSCLRSRLHTTLYARPHSSFVIFPATSEFSRSGLVFAEWLRESDPPLTGNTVMTEAGDCPGDGLSPMQKTDCYASHRTGDPGPAGLGEAG